MLSTGQISASFDASAVLTIRVGDGPGLRDFVVHEAFLVYRSELFRRAMNGKWEESASRIVSLSDDDPNTFGLYVSFIYTAALAVKNTENNELTRKEKTELLEEEYDHLIRLYTLAEKLEVSAAKDASVSAVFEILENEKLGSDYCLPTFSTMSWVYDHTPEESFVRRLIVDMANTCNIDSLRSAAGILPRDLVRDLLVSLRLRIKGRNAARKEVLEPIWRRRLKFQRVMKTPHLCISVGIVNRRSTSLTQVKTNETFVKVFAGPFDPLSFSVPMDKLGRDCVTDSLSAFTGTKKRTGLYRGGLL